MAKNEKNAEQSEERQKILSLVSEGTITADEAVEMLKAVDEAESREQTPSVAPQKGGARWIHIHVIDDSDKVDIRLPLGLVNVITSFIPEEARRSMEEQGVNIHDLMRMVKESGTGKLVEVEEEGGAHVEISLE